MMIPYWGACWQYIHPTFLGNWRWQARYHNVPLTEGVDLTWHYLFGDVKHRGRLATPSTNLLRWLVVEHLALSHDLCRNQWRKGVLGMCNFSTPSDPHSYGSCDKSMNPYPLRNHIYPNSATARAPESTWPAALWLLGPDSFLVGNYVISQCSSSSWSTSLFPW